MPSFPYSFWEMNFVWRQLRQAFFGALTLVGALFVFLKEENKMKKEIYEKPKLEIIALSDTDIICTSRPGEDDSSNDGEWM